MTSLSFEPWKSKQTPREIFTAQMHGKGFERSFNMEFGWWEENFVNWSLFYENGICNTSQGNLFFGFDKINALGGENWIYPAFKEEVISDDGVKQILRNADGLTAEVFSNHNSSIPHYLSSSIRTSQDWYDIKAERFVVDHPGRTIDIDALKAECGPCETRDWPLGVWTGSMLGKVRDMLTFENMCYMIYDEPDMVEDMIETACQLAEHSLKQLLPHFQFDYACGWEDICYKNGPIISPELFKEWVVPRYKRIYKLLKQYGIDIWYVDCDGDVSLLIPHMLDAGINTLFPFEVNACGHPSRLISEYGGAIKIMGGIDKTQLIQGRDAIKKYLDSIEPLVARGNFIPHCDHLCPPDVNQDDYVYYLKYKQYLFG